MNNKNTKAIEISDAMAKFAMEELVNNLNEASAAYYNGKDEIMSNHEWDEKFDQLVQLEKKTGIILPDSPTQKVGADEIGGNGLKKVRHEFPALSLDKTKDINEFPKVFSKSWNGVCNVMWKLDGSTIVLDYNNGRLVQSVTRGNGEIGSDMTHQAPYIEGIPMTIGFKGKLVVRGEALMTYSEFERINSNLEEGEEEYSNPRNLANATITMKEPGLKGRKVMFKVFKLVYMKPAADDKIEVPETFFGALTLLERLGFGVVEHELASADAIQIVDGKQINDVITVMNGFSDRVETLDYPVDGLVVASDDYRAADALPVTGHHPNRLTGFAFKWADECVETILRGIEWSPSRTGRINPVAVFDPVQLEGTTVTRASVHNVSIVKKLRLRVGDKISVFKSNKIIPQVNKNLTPGDELTYAESHACTCPVCGMETSPMITRSGDRDVEVEMCTNPDCAVKQVKKFVHFCERDCMDIIGLSEKTLEKFIEKGFIEQLADLYMLDTFEYNIAAMDGFGQKSYDNIWKSIQRSRKTTFVPFIHALGIPMVGKGQAKLFDKAYKGDVRKFFNDVYNRKCFTGIDGIGEKIELSLWDWGNKYLRWIPFEKELDGMERIVTCNTEVYDLLRWIDVEVPAEADAPAGEGILSGKTFVITGSVNHFKNRAELQAKIEELGGKATGSVTKKTSYLINNDVESTSGKNKKAKELGVPIISEDEFLEMVEENGIYEAIKKNPQM